MSIAIVTDSTAYLPGQLCASVGVSVVPLHVIIDDREYTEGVDLPLEVLGAALRSSARVRSSARPCST